jgi:hypothetical protein
VFIRKKIVKGREYYQVVESVRQGDKVRQRLIVALGGTPDPVKALRQMKQECNFLRYVPVSRKPTSKEPSAERVAEHKQKVRLQGRIAELANVLKKRLIGAKRPAGRTRRRTRKD